MPEVLHITDRAGWQEAARIGEYRMSTRGVTLEQEGFIHCSLRQQLRGVAEFLYPDAGRDDLVVLVIDSAKVPSAIRFEPAGPGGPEFPHIYGPLPVSAVTDVVPVTWDGADRMVLPGSEALAPAGPDQPA
jgi:uncharacterized protein (DUF952 family)